MATPLRRAPRPPRSAILIGLIPVALLCTAARGEPPAASPSAQALRSVKEALGERDPIARRAILEALKTRVGKKAGTLADYLHGYDQDRCVRQEVSVNLDLEDFDRFYRATVGTQEGLRAVCKMLKAGKNADALRQIDALLLASPRSPALHLNRAVTEARLGDGASAGSELRESRKTPLSLETPAPEGECLCSPGLRKEAQELSDRMKSSQQAQDMGVEAFLKGDKPGALAKLGEAVDLDPSNLLALRSRAVALESSGEPGRAVIDYQKALALARTDAERADLLLAMASAQERANAPAAAAASLEAARPLLGAGAPQLADMADRIAKLKSLVPVLTPLPVALTAPPARPADAPPPRGPTALPARARGSPMSRPQPCAPGARWPSSSSRTRNPCGATGAPPQRWTSWGPAPCPRQSTPSRRSSQSTSPATSTGWMRL